MGAVQVSTVCRGGSMRRWLKKIIRWKDGTLPLLIVFAFSFMPILFVLSPVIVFIAFKVGALLGTACGVITWLSLSGPIGSIMDRLFSVSERSARRMVRWANSDDEGGLGPPPDKYLLEATQELDDYLSDAWLEREIENLRKRCVRHFGFCLGICEVFVPPRCISGRIFHFAIDNASSQLYNREQE
jgi:hypothetical protein